MKIILFHFIAFFCFAEDAVLEAPPKEVGESAPAIDKITPTIEEKKLSWGLRLDSAFSGGDPDMQGFYLPSFRIHGQAKIFDGAQLSIAMGQTRDFTSLYLPQIMPVEGVLTLSTKKLMQGPELYWKLGMFIPYLNPRWSLDLADVNFPQYSRTQELTLPYSDIGTEVGFLSESKNVKISVGAFNGSGILSFNTNNTKLFTSNIEIEEDFAVFKILLGSGVFYHSQSVYGSSNYKSNWALDSYLEFRFLNSHLIVTGDYLLGRFEDSTRIVYPNGVAGTVTGYLVDQLALYTRLEYLKNSPSSLGGDMRTIQMGSILDFSKILRVFMYYTYLEEASGGTNSGQIRVRIVL
jgi:hypothetical protein